MSRIKSVTAAGRAAEMFGGQEETWQIKLDTAEHHRDLRHIAIDRFSEGPMYDDTPKRFSCQADIDALYEDNDWPRDHSAREDHRCRDEHGRD